MMEKHTGAALIESYQTCDIEADIIHIMTDSNDEDKLPCLRMLNSNKPKGMMWKDIPHYLNVPLHPWMQWIDMKEER